MLRNKCWNCGSRQDIQDHEGRRLCAKCRTADKPKRARKHKKDETVINESEQLDTTDEEITN